MPVMNGQVKKSLLSCAEDFSALAQIEASRPASYYKTDFTKAQFRARTNRISPFLEEGKKTLSGMLNNAELTEQEVSTFRTSIDALIKDEFGSVIQSTVSGGDKTAGKESFQANKKACLPLSSIQLESLEGRGPSIYNECIKLAKQAALSIEAGPNASAPASSSSQVHTPLQEVADTDGVLSPDSSSNEPPPDINASVIPTTTPTNVQSSVMDGLDGKNLKQLVINTPYARLWAEQNEGTALAANQTDEGKRAYVYAVQTRARKKLDELESRTIQQPTPPSITLPHEQIPASDASILQSPQVVSSAPSTRQRSSSDPQHRSSSPAVSANQSVTPNRSSVPPPPPPRRSIPQLSSDVVSVIQALSTEDSLKITGSIDFTKQWVGSNLKTGLDTHLATSPNNAEDFYQAVQSAAQTQAITKLQQDIGDTNSSALATSPQVAQLGARETAKDKIAKLIEAIVELSDGIDEEKDKLTFGDRAIVFGRYALGRNKRLLEKEKQLADMQLVLEQAQALVKDSENSLNLARFYSERPNIDRNNQLLFLKTACSGFHKISKDIDALEERQQSSYTSQANATMIEQRRGTSGKGKTRLVTNVDNRAALAAGVMQTMELHNKAREVQGPGFVSSTTIEGADPTSVRFRGVALAREKDIIQYTEPLASGSLIYSETSVNKDGCPVATDRSEIVAEYPSDEWKSDARQAAMIKAENILANYKGKGTIVLRIEQYSGDKKADLARINMEYAAILALSGKNRFSSYPKIDVKVPGFEPPARNILGQEKVADFIKTHLGVPPYPAQTNMAKELKALREKGPSVTHGVGIDAKGKVVAPEKEIGVLNASNLARNVGKGQPSGSSATDDSVSMFSGDDSSSLSSDDVSIFDPDEDDNVTLSPPHLTTWKLK